MSTRTFGVSGLKQLEARLAALGGLPATKAFRAAARKAFMPVLVTARQLARKEDGTPDEDLAASLSLAVRIPKRGDVALEVGLKVGPKKVDHEIVDGADLGVAQLIVVLKRRVNASFRWHWAERAVRPHKLGISLQKQFQKAALHEAIRKRTFRSMRRKESQSLKRKIVASKAYQAQRRELGHPGAAARPFLRPAFDQHWRRIPRLFAVELDKEIKRAIAKVKR